jgi:hypothetical protein
MKKFLIVLTICILPILAYSEYNPVEPPTVTPSKPLLSIAEALDAAQGYVRAKGVDVSGQYIHSVRLSYDDGSRRQGHYWRIQWAWSLPRMGGEYGLRIYTDGTVIPDPAGP